MATAKEFSITRTRNSFKPRVSQEDLPFFEDTAGNVYAGLNGTDTTQFTGSGSTTVAHLPYTSMVPNDGESVPAPVPLIEVAELPENASFDYRIDGGFNNNCVIITWDFPAELRMEWVCLKTFTGMQLKYASPKKRAKLIFAFADEDAFAYCNKMPCEECGFRCKSGFVAYALVRGLGVVRMPLERISTLGIIGAGAKANQ